MADNYGAGAYAPLAAAGPNNHGGYILVAIYIFLALIIITIITRLVSRLANLDDGFIVVSVVFAIANAACIHRAVELGLGQHVSDVATQNLEQVQKFVYAGQILVILSITSAKIALGLLVDLIVSPKPGFKLISRITLGAIGAWCFASIFAIAFQCSLPRPWSLSGGQCVDMVTLYSSIEAFNIILDIAQIVLVTALMWNIQVNADRRWQIIGLFAMRLLVAVTAIGQVVSISKVSGSTDVTWALTRPTIWTQALVAMSTITACLPGMKRTLQDMSSGLSSMMIPDGLQFTSNAYASRGQSRMMNTSRRGRNTGTQISTLNDDRDNGTSVWHSSTTNAIRGSRVDAQEKDMDSSESTRGLRDDEILQTKEIVLDYENSDAPGYYRNPERV